MSEPEAGFEQVGSEPPREKRRRIEEDLADVSDADSLISETWEPSSTSTAEVCISIHFMPEKADFLDSHFPSILLINGEKI